jgi:hypothetical protein
VNKRFFFRREVWIIGLIMLLTITTAATVVSRGGNGYGNANRNPGLFFVDYRHLDGGKDGIALVDLNPESKRFGKIMQRKEIGTGVLPHHLYFNNEEKRLYTTALGGDYLYEVILDKGRDGVPRMTRIVPVDTGGNLVGEDMFFTRDNSRYYVTFLMGQGGEKAGSVGVFDARTNELIETIVAPSPDDPSSGQPFIMHPHGISANEDLGLMMVTSDAHAEQPIEIGNTVTTIDMATNKPIKTQLVAESWDDLSETVEVLMLRGDLPPYALVTTINGGDIWIAEYDEASGTFGEFVEVVDGEQEGLGVALEFYIHSNHHGEKELYVSFAVPGVVNVYSLDSLPDLPLKRTITTGPGAHHMAFFETESGRELIVVQNNLINIDGLNDGTLMVLDSHTGELVRTLDMAEDYGLMPESIESAFGHGADLHH